LGGRKTVNEKFETAGICNTYLSLEVGVKAEASVTVLTVDYMSSLIEMVVFKKIRILR